MADRRIHYVKRTRWRACENGDRVATCYHRPRCGPAGPPLISFGRAVTGWTRVRGDRQAAREAAAWQAQGWTTTTVLTSVPVRAEVRAWERGAKGHPGETTTTTG